MEVVVIMLDSNSKYLIIRGISIVFAVIIVLVGAYYLILCFKNNPIVYYTTSATLSILAAHDIYKRLKRRSKKLKNESIHGN